MKQSTKKKFFIGGLTTVVLLGGIGIGGYYIASDYLAKNMVKSFMSNEITGNIQNILPEGEKVPALNEIKIKDIIDVKAQKDSQGQEANTTENTKEPDQENTEEKETKEVSVSQEKDVLGGYVEKLGEEATLEDVVNDAIGSIAQKDKNTMMKLVLGNLSSSDIGHLASLASDGISSNDLAAAKELAYSRFSEEEIVKIKQLYTKYYELIP